MVAARETKARARQQRQGGDSTRTSQPVTLPPDVLPRSCSTGGSAFARFSAFRLVFRCFSGSRFGKRISALFCHLSRILIEKRRGAQCQMWVIICHVCIDLDDRKEGGCGVLHDRKVGNSVIGMIGKGRGRKDQA